MPHHAITAATMIVATNASSNDALSLVFIVIITCNFYVFKHFFVLSDTSRFQQESLYRSLPTPTASDNIQASMLFRLSFFLSSLLFLLFPLFLSSLPLFSSLHPRPHSHRHLRTYTAGAIYALHPS